MLGNTDGDLLFSVTAWDSSPVEAQVGGAWKHHPGEQESGALKTELLGILRSSYDHALYNPILLCSFNFTQCFLATIQISKLQDLAASC